MLPLPVPPLNDVHWSTGLLQKLPIDSLEDDTLIIRQISSTHLRADCHLDGLFSSTGRVFPVLTSQLKVKRVFT